MDLIAEVVAAEATQMESGSGSGASTSSSAAAFGGRNVGFMYGDSPASPGGGLGEGGGESSEQVRVFEFKFDDVSD